MSRMRVVALAGALLCAVVAGLMAKNVISRKKEVEVRQEVVTKIDTVDVLVATRDLQMGDKVADTLSWKPWPKDNILPAMINRTDKPEALKDFAMARARVPIYKDEPVIERKLLTPTTGGFMSAVLPKGMRAISVAISSRSSAGGFILPNDRVDVILTTKIPDPKTNIPLSHSETVIENVRVLAVNQLFKQAGSDEQVAIDKGETATLELTQVQAEAVAQSEATGELSLSLRSLADSEGMPADVPPELSGRFKGKATAASGGPLYVRAGVASFATSQ